MRHSDPPHGSAQYRILLVRIVHTRVLYIRINVRLRFVVIQPFSVVYAIFTVFRTVSRVGFRSCFRPSAACKIAIVFRRDRRPVTHAASARRLFSFRLLLQVIDVHTRQRFLRHRYRVHFSVHFDRDIRYHTISILL